MAYFKRNGLILPGNAQTVNVKYEPIDNVKYANTNLDNVKYENSFSEKSIEKEDRQEKTEHNNQIVSSNSSFVTEHSEEPEYKWVESRFLKSIEKERQGSNAYLFKKPSAYWGIDKVIKINWVSVRLRCLLESIIKLSNYSKIDSRTLLSLTDAFNRLVQSSTFKDLPNNYPYTELIKELCIKLNRLIQKGIYTEQLKFSLSQELKSRLIGVRLEMLPYFPPVKFSELDFSGVDKEKDEEGVKLKKKWEYNFEAWKRNRLNEEEKRNERKIS